MLPARTRALLDNPIFWVTLVYVCGVGLRLIYTLLIQRPEQVIYADMGLYVQLANKLHAGGPLTPADMIVPLGYPALLAFLTGGGGLSRAVAAQIVISCLVPPAMGLLGRTAYARRTGLLAIVFSSLYFPFIEYGALFLTEIHFILWLALAFIGFFGAHRAERRGVSLALAAAGGLALSIAASIKSVALPAAFAFFVVEGIALFVSRPARSSPFARLKPWLFRAAMVAIAAAPLLIVLARVCTNASNGNFCVTGNKMGSDFLLGHYGRIADIEWRPSHGDSHRFGSPSSWLRHYETHAQVSFAMSDNAANTAEAWRWIAAHPGEAIALSLDHVYDTLFGTTMWPTMNGPHAWLANLSQFVFIIFLFGPTVLGCAAVVRGGARALVATRTALVAAPIAALLATVAIATGEVRYRIPFDVFFILIACAYAVGDLRRVDGAADAG